MKFYGCQKLLTSLILSYLLILICPWQMIVEIISTLFDFILRESIILKSFNQKLAAFRMNCVHYELLGAPCRIFSGDLSTCWSTNEESKLPRDGTIWRPIFLAKRLRGEIPFILALQLCVFLITLSQLLL